MNTRLSYKYVKEYIESYPGYKLLSEEYINETAKLLIQCPKNHNWNTSFASFRSGNRCATCGGTKRKTIEEAKALFENNGYKLLDKKYINSKHKMQLLCPKNHVCHISYRRFDEGGRCTFCSGRRKKTIEEVKAIYEEAGHILLEKDFKTNKTKMRSLCPNGHLCFTTYGSFISSKHKCKKCSGKAKKDINSLQSEFAKHGYILLSNNYVNAHTNMQVLCPKKHKFETSYNSFFTKGNKCSFCSKNKKQSFEEVKALFEKEGYICLSTTYKNATEKMNLVCPKGHKCTLAYYTFKNGHRCPYCAEKGFDLNKPGNLYYLKIDINQHYFYKIGITNRPIQARISEFPYPCKLLWYKTYLFGYIAYEKEQSILRKYEKHKCKSLKFKFNGSSELFTKDVLKKDFGK